MIIIDKIIYEKLLRTKRTQKVSDEIIVGEEAFQQYLDMISGIYSLEVRETIGVLLDSSQINIKLISSDPNRNTKDFSVSFKPDFRKIALLDNLEEIVEVPLNFTPPFAVQVPLREPKPRTTESVIPYEVLYYYPWGYDLERNIQIWKKR